MKNVLIILGHPSSKSFNGALADNFAAGAAGHSVEKLYLGDLKFDPVLWMAKEQEFEANLTAAQEKIKNADHLVFVYPNWWGGMPALLKGFIDRTFTMGFAYTLKDGEVKPRGLLGGKTAEIILTMDTPSCYYRLVLKMPGIREMKYAILKLCGVNVRRVTEFTSMRKSTEALRDKWKNKAERLGREI